jgi:hypothetical protein
LDHKVGRDSPLLQSVQSDSVDHSGFYPIYMGGNNSPGSKVASRVLLATCLHIVPEIRMCGCVPKFLHTSLGLGEQLGTGTTFFYSLIFYLKLFVPETIPFLTK